MSLGQEPTLPSPRVPAQWQLQSCKWRSDLRVSPTFSPWTSHAEFQGLDLKRQKRALDLVDCAWVSAYKRAKLETTGEALQHGLHNDLFVDVSQNHVRRPLSCKDGNLRTLLTSSMLYHYGTDRVLLPVEHLFLQGYDHEVVIPDGVSSEDVRKLAGEAIALPSLASVLWSLHLTKDLTLL